MVGCLFVSMLTKAQNPFLTKADIIAQFDVSPNNQLLCCKWWGADAMAKVRIKDLSTQNVLDVDSINLKKSFNLADGIAFLADNLILFGKDKMILSYDIYSLKCSKLFNLSSIWSNNPRSLAVTNDKKGVYLLADAYIYYADIRNGIQDSICLNKGTFVTGISPTANNQVIYGIREGRKDKGINQIWRWDGRNLPVNMTEQFSKLIKVPYLVEATSNPNLYIVANAEGVYRFDTSTQNAKKLVDNDKDDPVIFMRVSADCQTIYYLTAFHSVIIRTMNIDGKQGGLILF